MTRLVSRCVCCFDKQTEKLANKIPLVGVSLGVLRRIFDVPEEDPMFAVWDIGPSHAGQLQPFLPEELELDKYYCELHCDAVPIEGPEGPPRRIKKPTFDPFIRFFEKGNENNLIKNVDLEGISIQNIREIFGLSEDDPLEDELPINEKQAAALQPFASERIDPTQYECVLEPNINYVWVPATKEADAEA